jgi:hypothetical protein
MIVKSTIVNVSSLYHWHSVTENGEIENYIILASLDLSEAMLCSFTRISIQEISGLSVVVAQWLNNGFIIAILQ